MTTETSNDLCVLQAAESAQKIKRMAYQILEQNHNAQCIVLAGIKNRGLQLAESLATHLRQITQIPIVVTYIRMNKQQPSQSDITTGIDLKAYRQHPIVVVDDVGNTGRTLLYALKPFMDEVFETIQIAVLVDRKHKTYPVHPNYVGLSLATTLQEHITVVFESDGTVKAYLA